MQRLIITVLFAVAMFRSRLFQTVFIYSLRLLIVLFWLREVN